ncbi:Na+/H+ antiporter NhaA [Pseudodesulfovibrio sp.]|uniref:Na+/H+ antiporter NhaA n=1 Tax=unclassified Pseudodesulfovibrio TaxID=2661612 RepID=UPI003B00AC2C
MPKLIRCGLDPIDKVMMPFSRFFETQASGGILLIGCAVLAMIWANSPWAGSYEALWSTHFTVGYGPAMLEKPLILWVNDGLMALFFFVVGLEIKREFMVGELSTISQALLPIVAAVGGMVVPAGIYALINGGGPGVHGWGVPMATDIAFALGILALLGDRVPVQLKVFLTAVAIVDDIGAVLVIALFYTSSISVWLLVAAAGGLLVAFAGNRMGVRTPVFYALVGAVVWVLVLKSGVHSTVAGVLMAFTIPADTPCDPEGFLSRTGKLLDEYRSALSPGSSVLTNSGVHSALLSIDSLATTAQTPLQRLEHALHPVVEYAIMPVFALANAGVVLGGDIGTVMGSPVTLGIMAGLVLGKPLGILLSVWGVAFLSGGLPSGLKMSHFLGVGMLAGIGFTMSLFIAALAFDGSPGLLTGAKTGVLAASCLAGILGYVLLDRSTRSEG